LEEKKTGILRIEGRHTVDATVTRCRETLDSSGITLFALIDHSGEAARVGLTMRPTKLLVFGSPKVGTPVMQAAPSAALDLPLKLLIAEDAEGRTWISYNSPEFLRERHSIPEGLVAALAAVQALARKVAE
jgi:uncharacterized protein (DUF302 family)